MKLFKRMSLILLALLVNGVMAAEPVTLPYNGRSALVPISGNAGRLTFQASMNRKTRDCWYWVHFLDAKNEKQMSVRIDPDKLIYYPGQGDRSAGFAYKTPLPMEKMMSVDIKVINGIYQVAINGEELPRFVVAGAGLKNIQLRGHNCGITYKDVAWDAKGASEVHFSLFGKDGIDSLQYLPVPTGNYELSYGFKAEFKGGERTHYGVEIGSGNGNKERVMLIFWDNGFQMLQGKNSKWLGNVDPKTFNGQHHVFTLKKTDEDFYEVYLDGKLINNFEAEVPAGGRFNFWSYKQWAVTFDAVKLTKLD